MHHFISLFFLVILCSMVDVIHGYFDNLGFISFVISFSHIIAKVFYYIYFKYLMEFKYYFCLNILSISGVCYFIINIFSIIIFYFVHKGNDSNEITIMFYNYYRRFGSWNMVEHYLLGLIAYGLIQYPLDAIVIEKLTPNYAIIAYQIGKIPQSIVYEQSNLGWLIFIIFVFQVIFLLFYLEIIECNFCSLSENTKRNIDKRSGIEQEYLSNPKNDTQSRISVKGGYDITEEVKNQECELQKVNSVYTCEEKSEFNN